jgi:hypothetical protein
MLETSFKFLDKILGNLNLFKSSILLYGSLEVDNSITKEELNLKNLYSVEDGIRLMINGRD